MVIDANWDRTPTSRPARRTSLTVTAWPASIRISSPAITPPSVIAPAAWNRALEALGSSKLGSTLSASDSPVTRIVVPAFMSMFEPERSKVAPPGWPGPAAL